MLDESTGDCNAIDSGLLVVIECGMGVDASLLPFGSSIRLVARQEHTPYRAVENVTGGWIVEPFEM